MEIQGTQIAKMIFKKEVGGFTISNRKPYYKARVIKKVWNWHKDSHIDQWNRTESLDINLPIHSHLILNKDAKTTQWGKEQSF